VFKQRKLLDHEETIWPHHLIARGMNAPVICPICAPF